MGLDLIQDNNLQQKSSGNTYTLPKHHTTTRTE